MKIFLFLMTLICHTFYGHAQTPTAYLPFIPKGYSIIETLKGDLNKDGIEDEALLIKRTDKTKFVKNEYGETEDLNRRGLIVLFNHVLTPNQIHNQATRKVKTYKTKNSSNLSTTTV